MWHVEPLTEIDDEMLVYFFMYLFKTKSDEKVLLHTYFEHLKYDLDLLLDMPEIRGV